MSKAAADTLEKVSAEFESETLAELESGRGEAITRIQTVKRQVTEAVSKILENGARQAESLKRQIIGAAELETRNSQLKSLENAVNEVFAAAVDSLTKLASDRYEKTIVRLIDEGIEVIGPRAMVSSNASESKAVAGAIRKLNGGRVKLTHGDEGLETVGGVVLTSPDGTIRFDNTFEARLERMKPSLRKEVAGLLTRS